MDDSINVIQFKSNFGVIAIGFASMHLVQLSNEILYISLLRG